MKRRGFLKLLGIAAAASTGTSLVSAPAAAAKPAPPLKEQFKINQEFIKQFDAEVRRRMPQRSRLRNKVLTSARRRE